MNNLPHFSDKYPLLILRILLGIIFITHGVARIYVWSLPDFGKFLTNWGFPWGEGLAWAITIGEIVSGSLLALGFWVRWCLLFHTLIIVMGIFLVHIHLGWFVVGLAGGGVEYSLLILAVMAVLYSRVENS
ncbi:MAG: DoxX family protein [Microscillaceae bacterium]|jgi:putative oxidoreductase|nr:DoxX family protein [Microscillaceae bacterium]